MYHLADKTIARTLLYVRAQIIRDDLEGLEHVEALLKLRGVDPDGQAVPERRDRHFRRSELRKAVLAALRARPGTTRQIAERVAETRPDVPVPSLVKSTKTSLAELELLGVIGREKRVWLLNKRRART